MPPPQGDPWDFSSPFPPIPPPARQDLGALITLPTRREPGFGDCPGDLTAAGPRVSIRTCRDKKGPELIQPLASSRLRERFQAFPGTPSRPLGWLWGAPGRGEPLELRFYLFLHFFISSFLAQEFYPAGWGGGAQKEILGNFPMDLGWMGPREVLLEAGPALGSHQGSIVFASFFFPFLPHFPDYFAPSRCFQHPKSFPAAWA